MSQAPELTWVLMSNLFGLTDEQMERLASQGPEQRIIVIDATYLKAHRPASSLRAKKRGPATNSGV